MADGKRGRRKLSEQDKRARLMIMVENKYLPAIKSRHTKMGIKSRSSYVRELILDDIGESDV